MTNVFEKFFQKSFNKEFLKTVKIEIYSYGFITEKYQDQNSKKPIDKIRFLSIKR